MIKFLLKEILALGVVSKNINEIAHDRIRQLLPVLGLYEVATFSIVENGSTKV